MFIRIDLKKGEIFTRKRYVSYSIINRKKIQRKLMFDEYLASDKKLLFVHP